MTYKQLQDEVKRGALRDQGGTTFDTGIGNIVNRSIFRIGRECPWRSVRRKAFFTTVATYNTGTGAGTFTNSSTAVTVTGATFLTDGIEVGRYIKLSGSGTYYIVRQITGETTLVLDRVYSGITTTTGTYSILGQGEYNLPIQAGHRMFMWHKEYGYPWKMIYITDQDFYDSGVYDTDEAIPLYYKMWGANMIIEQLREPSVVTIVSSSASDTSQIITVFGTVSGYPDFEELQCNGTSTRVGIKSFSSIDKVVKAASTVGRITATANSGNTTVSVLPVGDTTTGILYDKVQLYPLPNTPFEMKVQYYKDPLKLVNDGDVHELGEDFDQAIIFLAVSVLKYENNQSEGDKFFALFKDELKTLRRTNMDKIDWFPRLKRAKDSRSAVSDILVVRNLGFRQVGPYFGPRVR